MPSRVAQDEHSEKKGDHEGTLAGRRYIGGVPIRNLVKILALPANRRGLTENGRVFGQSSTALLANYDPATSSLKTLQTSLFSDLSESSVTLPRSGMMRNGKLYQQMTLVRTTSEKESGLWPTPGRIDQDFCMMRIETAQKREGQIHVTSKLIADYGKRYPLPSFGQRLMGYPDGWLPDGKDSETP